VKYPINRRLGLNYPTALRPCIEQPFDSFLENLSDTQLTPAAAAYCLDWLDQSGTKSDNASGKSQSGTTLLSDPYSLHFVITLSQAQEPENLLETLLAGLTNVFSLSECRKIVIEDDLGVTQGEQILGLSSREVEPGDFEFEWHRTPETVTLSSEVLTKVRAGHIHVKSTEDSTTFWFPVMHKGKCRSIMALTTREALEPHLAKIRALLEIYANLNFMLDQGQKDKLTGLLNRQTFDSKISRMLEKQRSANSDYADHHEERRHGEELQRFPWLAIIDIDHFKEVNDQYGHLYGDEVILTIGQILKQSFRRSDLLFRFGGEEFVVLLEPIPAANVEYALERLRRTVENQCFQQVGRVSVSIGYAKFIENMFPPMIIDRADQALYFAKNNGRNQVANYEALVEQGKLQALDHKEGSIDLF
jgi:diguanylate cyclase (GGDEF)-like protein